MESDPLPTALSKLEQLVNDKFQVISARLDASNVHIHHLHSKIDELANKITVLYEKVDSVHSITNDFNNNTSTSNVAISGGHIKTK